MSSRRSPSPASFCGAFGCRSRTCWRFQIGPGPSLSERWHMETNDSVQFAGGMLGRHRHICAFFNSIDEEYRVLRSFIKDGFERGDKTFHLVDPELRAEHLKQLAEAGINVQEGM